MSTPKISIILPVYNAKATLSRMIDSILKQTFSDWELLLVDDGSTDGSETLCDFYAKKDIRIRVFHKKNGGVATARQCGVDHANGIYSIHADSDDWIESTMLEEMYNKALETKADIVIADFVIVDDKGEEVYKVQHLSSCQPTDVLFDIHTGKLFGGLWNKLVRHSLYASYNVRFYEGINYCEDVLVFTQILKNKAVKITAIDKAYYHYVLNTNSITNHITKSTFNGIQAYVNIVTTFFPDEERFQKVKEAFPLGIFQAGFMNNHFDRKNIKKEFSKVRRKAYQTKSIRWLIGYLCIDLGWYGCAHRLIHY